MITATSTPEVLCKVGYENLEEEVVVVTNSPVLLHPGHIGEARGAPGLREAMPGDLEEQDSLPQRSL